MREEAEDDAADSGDLLVVDSFDKGKSRDVVLTRVRSVERVRVSRSDEGRKEDGACRVESGKPKDRNEVANSGDN